MSLYLADFDVVACDWVRFHLIVILKQNVNFSFNIYSLTMTVISVEMLEELKYTWLRWIASIFSYLFVNGKEISKSKEDNKNVSFSIQFCLGSISNGFCATESRELFLQGNVYDFSFDYNDINKSDIPNIHKYLMVKYNIKCLLIKHVFIGLLCFSESLLTILNTANQVKCISFNNQ